MVLGVQPAMVGAAEGLERLADDHLVSPLTGSPGLLGT
jgi:hypothetical protein